MKKILTVSALVFMFLFLTNLAHLDAGIDLPFDEVEPDISMDFQDANLKDILKMLSIQSNLNFIASEAVQDRKVTLYLDKVPLHKAMDKIFKANNLSYDMDKSANVFIVKDWGKPEVETVTKVFYLKYATVSTSSMREDMSNLMPNVSESFALGQTSGGTTSTTSGGTTGTGGTSGGGGSGKWKQEDQAGITYAIKKLLSANGSLIEDFRTNSLVVTDIPSRMEVIVQVVASLDVPVPQVLLEVEMLDVSKDAVDQLGFMWPQTLAQLTVSGSKETAFPFGDKGTSGLGRTMTPDAGIFGGPGNGWNIPPWSAGNFGPSILTVIGGTIAFDFMKQRTDTKFLARPRILTLNNETAEIRIATDESIGVISTTASAGGSTGTTTSEAERTQTGVMLRVTPQINVEAGEVTLYVYPKVSDAKTGSSFIVQDQTYQFRDPEERSTKTSVRLKDGETVVLGGLIHNQSEEINRKVPVLGDLPLFGALFRHKSKTPNKERELLVFITPHIIKENRGVQLAQSPAPALPEREQGPVAMADRQAAISRLMSDFER